MDPVKLTEEVSETDMVYLSNLKVACLVLPTRCHLVTRVDFVQCSYLDFSEFIQVFKGWVYIPFVKNKMNSNNLTIFYSRTIIIAR